MHSFHQCLFQAQNLCSQTALIVCLCGAYKVRAEAKPGRSNDAAGALADVNLVRTSPEAWQAPPALKSINLDLLYREGDFELYWESLRRTNMDSLWQIRRHVDRENKHQPSGVDIPHAANGYRWIIEYS